MHSKMRTQRETKEKKARWRDKKLAKYVHGRPLASEQSAIIFYIYKTMDHAYEFIEPNSVGRLQHAFKIPMHCATWILNVVA